MFTHSKDIAARKKWGRDLSSCWVAPKCSPSQSWAGSDWIHLPRRCRESNTWPIICCLPEWIFSESQISSSRKWDSRNSEMGYEHPSDGPPWMPPFCVLPFNLSLFERAAEVFHLLTYPCTFLQQLWWARLSQEPRTWPRSPKAVTGTPALHPSSATIQGVAIIGSCVGRNMGTAIWDVRISAGTLTTVSNACPKFRSLNNFTSYSS